MCSIRDIMESMVSQCDRQEGVSLQEGPLQEVCSLKGRALQEACSLKERA